MAESQQEIRTTRLPKLRSSCDECGTAKLRCDRGQPSCSRCVKHRLNCQYGFSRKMGRPRRVSLHPTAQIQQDAPNPMNSGGTPDFDSTDGSTTEDLKLQPSTLPSLVWPGTNNIWNLDMNDWDDLTLLQLPTSGDTPSEWASLPSNVIPLATDYRATGRPPSIAQDETNSSHPTHQCAPGPSISASKHRFARTPESIGTLTNPDSSERLRSPILLATDLKSETHGCVRESIQLLASLSKPLAEDSVLWAGGGSSSWNHPVGNPSSAVSLDSNLCVSRQATESLVELLACPCAKSSAVSIVHASTIAHVLIWFKRAILTTSVPSIDSSQPYSHQMHPRSPSITRTTSSHSTIESGSLFTPGTTISTHKPGLFEDEDAETGRALRIQFLLGELKKVGKVISGFASVRETSKQPLPADPQARFSESLHQCMCAWLESEYAAVRDMMKTSLTQLNL